MLNEDTWQKGSFFFFLLLFPFLPIYGFTPALQAKNVYNMSFLFVGYTKHSSNSSFQIDQISYDSSLGIMDRQIEYF